MSSSIQPRLRKVDVQAYLTQSKAPSDSQESFIRKQNLLVFSSPSRRSRDNGSEILTITDKTRKMLWANSGKRCAICRKELIADATSEDDASIVGDECHIVSGSRDGPRYDPRFPKERIDLFENLILLCRFHHKVIDDQPRTFTVERLLRLKSNHEKWVTRTLDQDSSQHEKPVRISRKNGGIPLLLERITSGKELLSLARNTCALGYDYSDPANDEELDLISVFMETVGNLDVCADEISAQIQLAYDLGEQLAQLEGAGFWVFGKREDQVIEGGGAPPSSWPEVYIMVMRNTDERIVCMRDSKNTGKP